MCKYTTNLQKTLTFVPINQKVKQMAQISEIGEYKFIQTITKDIKLTQPSTIKGVGDDCAVRTLDDKRYELITTNQYMEGIHFNLTYFPAQHLGFKVAIGSMSDVYAMNGTPTQLLVSMSLSKRFSAEWIANFFTGVKSACEKYGVDLVGGDTTASLTGFTVNTTCIGEVEKEKITYRKGAKPTDLLCVTGDIGAAMMGFQLLERERRVFESLAEKSRKKGLPDPSFDPDFAGKEYILERALKPEPRADIIKTLEKDGVIPTAMIDVTKGLASDAMQLCEQSGVGCRIYEDKIPIDYFTASAAEEFHLNLTTVAMNGGEDYELLFTVPLALHDKVKDMDGVKVIGYVTEDHFGTALITRDGQEFRLKAQSYTALEGEEDESKL